MKTDENAKIDYAAILGMATVMFDNSRLEPTDEDLRKLFIAATGLVVGLAIDIRRVADALETIASAVDAPADKDPAMRTYPVSG